MISVFVAIEAKADMVVAALLILLGLGTSWLGGMPVPMLRKQLVDRDGPNSLSTSVQSLV